MADWSDESRAAIVKDYLDANPTAETSIEIVEKLATKYGTTVNGARMIIIRADKYISKAKATTSSDSKSKKKETKQESLDRLTAVIKAQELEADDAVISKLTGKAAAYFADVIRDATKEED